MVNKNRLSIVVTWARVRWLLLLVYFGLTGIVVAYGTAKYMDIRESAQKLIWNFFEWAGWYWWGIAIVLSGAALFYMTKLSAPRTSSGKIARLCHYIGFMCYLASWGNNALGGIAAMLVLAGTVIMIRQQAIACVAERKRTSPEHAGFGERVLRRLVYQ